MSHAPEHKHWSVLEMVAPSWSIFDSCHMSVTNRLLSSKTAFFAVSTAISISLITQWAPQAKRCAASFTFPVVFPSSGRRGRAFQISSSTSGAFFAGPMPLLTASVQSLKCLSEGWTKASLSRCETVWLRLDVCVCVRWLVAWRPQRTC